VSDRAAPRPLPARAASREGQGRPDVPPGDGPPRWLRRASRRRRNERQSLLDLAFTLGESHALRQVCEGTGDQYWRSRMVRLTEVEKADQAFDAQLRDKFNTGFAARQGEFPECDDASRQAEQQTARKGQALAGQAGPLDADPRPPAPTKRRRIPWRTTEPRARVSSIGCGRLSQCCLTLFRWCWWRWRSSWSSTSSRSCPRGANSPSSGSAATPAPSSPASAS
jgi:uncharacterized protein (TIGR02301 family)